MQVRVRVTISLLLYTFPPQPPEAIAADDRRQKSSPSRTRSLFKRCFPGKHKVPIRGITSPADLFSTCFSDALFLFAAKNDHTGLFRNSWVLFDYFASVYCNNANCWRFSLYLNEKKIRSNYYGIRGGKKITRNHNIFRTNQLNA